MNKLSRNSLKKAYQLPKTRVLPAPSGGINYRDGDAIKPNEATLLLNLIPENGKCTGRAGYSQYAATDGSAHTIFGINNSLISIGNGKAYKLNPAGNSLLKDGLSTFHFQTADFKQYMFGCSGDDEPFRCDGTTWDDADFWFTGLDVKTLVNVEHVRNRVWFCEAGNADVYYSNVEAITGELFKFQSSQLVRSNQCLAIAQYSQDAGDGFDDYVAMIFDTGEILLYRGDVTTDFTKVGTYQIDRPIGHNCVIKSGGEILILTYSGLVPLTLAIKGIEIAAMPVFGRIAPLINKEIKRVDAKTGWNGFKHNNLIYICTPVGRQIVLNTISGAWTVFDYPATDFAELDDQLYFVGKKQFAYKIGGITDDEKPIKARYEGAFVDINGHENHATQALPLLSANGYVGGRVNIDTDFFRDNVVATHRVLVEGKPPTYWGCAWGDNWSNPYTRTSKRWASVRGRGYSISVVMELDMIAEGFIFHGTRLTYIDGAMR